MDYQDFIAARDAGLLTISIDSKTDIITIEAKRFDPATGAETEPMTIRHSKDDLERKLDMSSRQYHGISAILAEFTKANNNVTSEE